MTLALFQPLRLFLNFFFFFCLCRLLCGLWRENSGLVSYEGPPGHLAQRLLPVSGLRLCFQARAPLLMSTALLEWWPRALVLGRGLEAGFLAFFPPTLICLIYSSFCLFFCSWLILWRFPVIPLCSSSCSGGSFVRFFSARTGPHRRILFVFIYLTFTRFHVKLKSPWDVPNLRSRCPPHRHVTEQLTDWTIINRILNVHLHSWILTGGNLFGKIYSILYFLHLFLK